MAILLLYPEILVAIFLCFLFLCQWRWSKTRSTITNWPVVGMLTGLLQNAYNLHEYVTWVLKQNGGTFEFKGPWFTNMNFMVTSDPMNIHHMLSKNFSNYIKGQKFHEILMFWEMGFSILSQTRGDIRGSYFNIFHRFTFDSVCLVALGFDPKCLSIEFPHVSHAKAFDQLEEGAFYRHIVPESYWKLQRWLQIGSEKKFSIAWKILDQFIYNCISSRQEELSQSRVPKAEEEKFDLLTAIGEQAEEIGGIIKSDKFLRDIAFNLLAAGRDTVSAGLTWLFWIVATHPSVEAKILGEIKEHLLDKGKLKDFSIDELSKLVYLHGAICESLRLYPPVPFEHKCSVQSDILPSGHSIRPNTTMIYSLYSMGRMESIWGQDCLDFKPERWISERGGIVHVPSFKFIAFNAGPRTCLGKDITFIQMKIIAIAILWNYSVQVVEGHPVSPSISVILHMKHGLKVRIRKRFA
ncbi:hypothetical protein ACB092_01G295100 [Castanea dentata]